MLDEELEEGAARVYIVRTQTVGAGPWLVSEVARKQEAVTGW